MPTSPKKSKTNLNCDFSHHAYCLVGDRQSSLSLLKEELLQKLNFDTIGNPDFNFLEYDLLKLHPEGKPDYNLVIEEIILPAQNLPVKSPYKIIVIAANDININAQNALLKFFEEPILSTKVFLLLPTANRLLPTNLSRLIVLNIDNTEPQTSHGLFVVEDFLAGTIADRLKIVSDILSAKSDEEISRGDIVEFLRNLLKLSFSQAQKDVLNEKDCSWLNELEKSVRYSEDPSCSFKIILEYVAIILPRKI